MTQDDASTNDHDMVQTTAQDGIVGFHWRISDGNTRPARLSGTSSSYGIPCGGHLSVQLPAQKSPVHCFFPEAPFFCGPGVTDAVPCAWSVHCTMTITLAAAASAAAGQPTSRILFPARHSLQPAATATVTSARAQPKGQKTVFKHSDMSNIFFLTPYFCVMSA